MATKETTATKQTAESSEETEKKASSTTTARKTSAKKSKSAEPSEKTTRKSAAKKTAKKAKDDELVKDEDTQVDDGLDDDAEVNDDDLDVDDLDEDLDDVDEDDADDDDVEDDEDEDEEEAKSTAPEQPKEKGAYVVSDTDDEEENIIPSGNPKRRVIAAGATADPVKDYLKQIGRVSLLNAEQEVDLSERIEAGLYAQHLLDTESEGMEFKRKRELKWAAADGKKAKDHLLKKGFKFSTYATWWIRQAITRAMADQARTIRVPVHMVEVINKLSRVQRQMLQDLGREPTPDELARELDMPVEKVQEVQKYGREPISLHTPLGEDGDSEFGDLIEDTDAIAPSDAVAFSLLQEQFKQVLETLSPREAGVIKMRYGLEDGQPKTLDDIGRVYGVTRERIRQIESKTMSKLRHPSRSQTLRDFLDQ